jgi:hypothetical protein
MIQNAYRDQQDRVAYLRDEDEARLDRAQTLRYYRYDDPRWRLVLEALARRGYELVAVE